jgi:hypothetical protein
MLGPRVWIESKKNKQFIIYSGLLAHDGAPFDALRVLSRGHIQNEE